MKTTELFFRYLVAAITTCAEYICTLFSEPQNEFIIMIIEKETKVC